MSGRRREYADRLKYLSDTLGEGIISQADIQAMSNKKGLQDDRSQRSILMDYINSQNIPVMNPQPANIQQSTMRVPLGQEFNPQYANLGGPAVNAPGRLAYGQSAQTAPYPYLDNSNLQETPLAAPQAQQASQGFWDRFKAGFAKNAAQPRDFPVSDRR